MIRSTKIVDFWECSPSSGIYSKIPRWCCPAARHAFNRSGDQRGLQEISETGVRVLTEWAVLEGRQASKTNNMRSDLEINKVLQWSANLSCVYIFYVTHEHLGYDTTSWITQIKSIVCVLKNLNATDILVCVTMWTKASLTLRIFYRSLSHITHVTSNHHNYSYVTSVLIKMI